MTTESKQPQSRQSQAFQSALDAFRKGNTRAAYEACLEILDEAPDFHAAAHLAGVIALDRGHAAVAADLLRTATRAAPTETAYCIDLAMALRALEDYPAALEALEQAPGVAAALNLKATLLVHLGRGEEAVTTLEALRQENPRDPDVLLRLGLLYRNLGELQAAADCLQQAISLQPDFPAAYWVLSSVQQATPQSNHIDEMNTLLARQDNAGRQAELCFALAKEYEDLQDYESAFKYLERGNQARRSELDYDPADDEALFKRIHACFAERPSRAASARNGPTPLFIVGLPRTGSTLLERMLTGHSGIGSAGELQVMERLVREVEQVRGEPYPNWIADLTQGELDNLGNAYLEKSRPFRGQESWFIDKMPMNFLYAGLILMLLPGARIISMRRAAADTCFSCYKQLFGGHYRFSYDLEELAAYYLRYDALMRHWQCLWPQRIVEVHYEDLVSDPEREIRRVLDFCGLGWESACLAFQSAGGTVNTPSAAQVRMPVHKRSVGRWRHYEKQLEPLLRALGKSDDSGA